MNHEYMAQPGGLQRPLRGADRRKIKQPQFRSDQAGLTQANWPPRNPVRFNVDVVHELRDGLVLGQLHADLDRNTGIGNVRRRTVANAVRADMRHAGRYRRPIDRRC